jgi:hypothetical protein
MRKIFLLLILFISVEVLAQPGDTIKKNRVEQTTVPASDSLMRNEDMERNVSNLLRLQKSIQAREAKEKRNALTRIGIGIALLIILIIGFRRKVVKK